MEKAIKKYFPVFALPTLVAFTIGFIVPFIMGIYLSFCEFTTVTDAKFVGLKNYLRVFSDSTFMLVHHCIPVCGDDSRNVLRSDLQN